MEETAKSIDKGDSEFLLPGVPFVWSAFPQLVNELSFNKIFFSSEIPVPLLDE